MWKTRMIRPWTTSIAALFVALLLTSAAPAGAAELIMFERAGCPYCEQFDREVAPIYPRTPVGRQAPLRRVDIYAPIPRDLDFVRVERVTPVFVLVDQGREIGRIRGYPGEVNFWGLIENLVAKIAPVSDAIHADLRSDDARAVHNP
jgi:hypothetical protein